MRRPFIWLCIVLAIFPVMKYMVEGSARNLPLQQTVELLLEETRENQEITVTGTVNECSATSSGLRLSIDHITIQRKDNSRQSLLPSINIIFTTEYQEIIPGDEILASGEVVLWETASNPGQFDAQSYYFFQNTACMLSHVQIYEVRTGKTGLTRVLYKIRRRLCGSYDSILEERQARTMSAVSLGEKTLMEREWQNVYKDAGIAHILAISGLHISLIGMLLYRFLRKFGVPFWGASAMAGTAVLFYALMTGFGISAIRAVIMFFIWLGAQICGRKYDMVTATATAATVLIFSNAGNLYQASFLLSFAAVLSIAVLLSCFRKVFLEKNYEKISNHASRSNLLEPVVTCMAVWLGTLPVTLFFFYQTAPWSILVNLAVIPLMTVLMSYGLFSALTGLVSIPLGTFLAAPVYYILGIIEFLCGMEQRFPTPVWIVGRPGLWRIACYYVLLFGMTVFSYRCLKKWKKSRYSRTVKTGRRKDKSCSFQVRRKLILCILWLCCVCVCICLMGLRTQKDLEILCLDVGQGDGALLRFPNGITCLVDGGSSSESDIWEYRISQAVKYYGVSTLDYIFLSHADRDHISGIAAYLQEYEPGFGGRNVHGITLRYLVLPPVADADDFLELRQLADEKGISVLEMEAGATIGTKEIAQGSDAWNITCLSPDASTLTGDRNEDSMVLMLKYGTFSMLFTGDLEGAAEQRLAISGIDLSADVLKVGHHGSNGASSEALLAQVRPAIAVISCSESNPYGHPAPETVIRLQNTGCEILETSKCGAVMISSDGESYSVETFR